MSMRASLAYLEYNNGKGALHIYHNLNDGKYYITDECHGIVEIPERIAKSFAKTMNISTEKEVNII